MAEENLISVNTRLSYIDPTDNSVLLDCNEPAVSPTSAALSTSTSRLNARAPEYLPKENPHAYGMTRAVHQYHHRQNHLRGPLRNLQMHKHHGPHSPMPVFHGFSQNEMGDRDQCGPVVQSNGISGDVASKATKQVEYYFSDLNLATTDHLMRFISNDPKGFVPISVIASFKKMKAFISSSAQLASVLRTSNKLVVSDDGMNVRRKKPITDSDLEELKARIIVAENLPMDHCYQNLVKVFSVAGCVRSIRTCYPQPAIGASVNHRLGKIDSVLLSKLHAFVEYETVEQAERAVEELNKDWRIGMRVRSLSSCMKHGQHRGRNAGYEGDWKNFEDDDITFLKQVEDLPRPDVSHEEMVDDDQPDKDGTLRKGIGRGRGIRGRGRGHSFWISNHSGNHPTGNPPNHTLQTDQYSAASKPPGPRMPDGTRGFTFGRGKTLKQQPE